MRGLHALVDKKYFNQHSLTANNIEKKEKKYNKYMSFQL